jgi:diguanylate cyclase
MAPLPPDEAQRLQALREYLVLDTAHEPVFDAITALAAAICDVPIALISLVDTDRQWFKSRIGVDDDETPRESAFCAHALHGDGVMEVPNALEDSRFADNPFVLGEPNVRFYAGATLRNAEGHALGTVCVVDRRPRMLSEAQRRALEQLSVVTMKLLEARRQAFRVELLGRSLDDSASEAYVVDAERLRFVHLNASALRNTGYTREEAASLPSDLVLTEIDASWIARVVAKARETGERNAPVATLCQRRDGTVYPVTGSVQVADAAGVTLVYLVLNDITDRVAAEDAIRAAERRTRTITDNLPALIAYIDAEQRYRFMNATYAVWLQRPVVEMLGRTLAEVHDPALYALLEPHVARALSGQRESFELEQQRAGRTYYVRGVFVPERDADGRVSGVYALTQDVTRIRLAEDELRRLAQHDPLTGLANRARLVECCAEAMRRNDRDGKVLALLYIDLDRFKSINDSRGHLAGDEVLREFGRRLLARLRQTDCAARLGGDEFAVVLEGLATPIEAERVAADIVRAMATPIGGGAQPLTVTASIGIAIRHGESDPASLIRRADEALYRAKGKGRNGFSL